MRRLATLACFVIAPMALAQPTNNGLRNILITGYWPPTNEMLRPWSRNTSQNPTGWVGENWEGRGFNVHAYFPEFPGGLSVNPRGTGDFEVDYQDTVADFNTYVAQLQPAAIVTFSRDNTTLGWKLEPAYQRHRLPGEAQLPGRNIPIYVPDFFGNQYPTEALAGIPVGEVRLSNLPMQRITTSVAAAIPSSLLQPFIASYNPAQPDAYNYSGAFLSGFLPFIAARYRDAGSLSPLDPTATLLSGHVHVGTSVNFNVGRQATQITLREVTAQLQSLGVPSPGVLGMALAASILTSRRRRD